MTTKIKQMDEASGKIQNDMKLLLHEWSDMIGMLPDEVERWIERFTKLNTVSETTPDNAATQCASTLQLYKRMIDFTNLSYQVTSQLTQMSQAFFVISLAQSELHDSVLDLSKFDFEKILNSEPTPLHLPQGETETRKPPEPEDDDRPAGGNGGYGRRL